MIEMRKDLRDQEGTVGTEMARALVAQGPEFGPHVDRRQLHAYVFSNS
jgi:hypothetical protein